MGRQKRETETSGEKGKQQKTRDEVLDCKCKSGAGRMVKRLGQAIQLHNSPHDNSLLVCSDGLSAGLQENYWHYFHETQWKDLESSELKGGFELNTTDSFQHKEV